MLMASGMMGVSVERPTGQNLAGRRAGVKVQEVVAGDHDDEGDGEDGDGPTQNIQTGETVERCSKVSRSSVMSGLTEFMGEHGETIAAHVLDTIARFTTWTRQTPKTPSRLRKGRKPLPGQAEPGLLMTQRHAAVAMARSVRVNGVGNVQGEMGIGKTTLAAGVTALLNAFPAIIICPPHLVPKWIREIEETIPGAKAVELRRIGRNADDPGDVNDVRAFFDAVKPVPGEKPLPCCQHQCQNNQAEAGSRHPHHP